MVENNVRRVRRAAKITMVQLAERAGLPVSTVEGVEHGAEPRVVTAIKIAKALHTQVERLWTV